MDDDVRTRSDDEVRTGAISRRAFFGRTVGLAGAAGVLLTLTGCPGEGDGDDDDEGDDDD